MKTTAWFLLTALLLVALTANAQAPRLLNVQGVLTDNAGVVLPDGTYTITFRLYDVPIEGGSLYSTYRSVTQVDGVFSIECEGQGGPMIERSLVWVRQALADTGFEVT